MIIKIPNPFPYQGSKRNIAEQISGYISQSERIIEPFAGSAAISLYTIARKLANHALINDLNAPLMDVLKTMVDKPEWLADEYERIWNEQQGREKEFFPEVRQKFNKTHEPNLLLFLLARCVKGAVRYNGKGEFNQSPDNRRLGRNPKMMRRDIMDVHNILNGKVEFSGVDYREVLQRATTDDLVYMDPPYQGVCNMRDERYFASIKHDEFIDALRDLSNRGIRYIVSYDGRTGDKVFGESLPIEELSLNYIEIHAGRSTQSTLLGRDDQTVESLYVSRNINLT